ncbi:MAG: 50S ribosomal protein L11 methyltransferase [Chloroflexota bacterium]|nr:50S ribosomal protein L11 methyltransferase [Chloroflexota bacterium]
MDWIELAVDVDREAVEAVSELFAEYGYNGGVVVEEAIVPQPDEDYVLDLSAPVQVRTYLPADGKAEDTRQRIAEALWHLGRMRQVGELRTARLKEEDWANAWKAHYQTTRIGRSMVIKPSWLDYRPAPGDRVIELDPGMAFGTGLHPTTRLCLEVLEDHAVGDIRRVLDLGTGSGILAIGTARLLPDARIWAWDTDPVAVEVAAANVAANGLADTILVEQGSLIVGVEPDIHFDLIIANILARVIIELAGAIAGALEPGGVAITSGIIDERGPEVHAALERAGLTVLETRQEGDWLAIIARRPSQTLSAGK